MDTRQIEYILMIAQENNITRAAEKLFISQSALNQQLLKLEKELGCQLFHRSRTNWRPTEEGKIYIEGAEKIMMVKKETYAKIQDCLHEGIATLDVGLTPGRGFRMFTAIYPALHEKYPGLIVTPVEMNVQRQQEAIAKGQLDIGFVTAAVKEKTNDHYLDLGKEEFVLVVPKDSSFGLEEQDWDTLPVIDLKKLENETFSLMYKSSTSRKFVDRLFEKAGFFPQIMMESSSTTSLLHLAELGLCNVIIPRYYIQEAEKDKVSAYVFKNHMTWDLSITYRSGSYLSDPAHTFISLADEYWREHLIPPQTN